MAIAFDAATVGGYSNPVDGKTFAHTCTGSDRILFVGTFGEPGNDSITGVTYAGVSMTKIAAKNTGGPDNRYSTLWVLFGPASGANNVVIAASGGDGAADAVSYTGVLSTSIDNFTTNSATGVNNITTLLTPIADNCWTIIGARNELGGSTAGAGSTIRANDTSGYGLYDSNAAITPPASYSMNIACASPTAFGVVMASFSPTAASSTTSSATNLLMGV